MEQMLLLLGLEHFFLGDDFDGVDSSVVLLGGERGLPLVCHRLVQQVGAGLRLGCLLLLVVTSLIFITILSLHSSELALRHLCHF